jgi:two-component system, NarL family, sensor histidine kinase DevS
VLVNSASTAQDGVRNLLEASRALTSELSLEVLLERIVQAAAQITGSRYAALGVIDRTGTQLERFITHGADAETYAAIGELPRGRGVLGVLIREATPLRLHDLSEDPRSVGFPPGHPPMRTFLGVPILLRGVAYGNLYLTEKANGSDYTEDDQELVIHLASQAAVAIENARLFEAATRWSKQLESLNEVGNALATETDLSRLLDLVATRLRDLIEARLVTILVPTGPKELRFAVAVGEGAEGLVGELVTIADSRSGRVFERRRSERVDSVIDDPEGSRELTRRIAARAGLWVPLVARDRSIGVISAYDKVGESMVFTDMDLRLAETFASRAAVAIDLSERVEQDALRRAVAAQEVERRRLARELHDETGQALTSILLGLGSLEDALEDENSQTAVREVRELVVQTLQDVRQLAVDLRPKVLDDFGLVPALERLTDTLAEQTGLEIEFLGRLADRLSEETETALYRIVQEALTNVVKHAAARHVSVVLTRNDRIVTALIEDDGRGFDPAATREGGFGIVGMRERVALLGGTLRVESRKNAGTTIKAEVPIS